VPKDDAPKRDATVADIARAANVSKAAAARALGDYGPVSAAMRDRVLAAAHELNYRPNALAKSMNTGRSNTIGVVVGDIENPFFAHAVRAISDVASGSGYEVILTNSGEDLLSEQHAIDVLLDKRVDALIVAPSSSVNTSHLQAAQATGRPLILLDRRADGGEFDSVTVDNRGAAANATAHLLDQGHTRIAFISTLDHPVGTFSSSGTVTMSTVADRIRGVTETLAKAGVADPAEFVRLDANRRGVAEVTRDLLTGDRRATAIIASDSLVALAAFKTIRRMGLRIPDDVSLIAFDNPEWTEITTPPLTVVEQPIYELGAEAARLALRRIDGNDVDGRMPVFDTALVLRESTGPAPRPVAHDTPERSTRST
jgi:Transcriptional regulators